MVGKAVAGDVSCLLSQDGWTECPPHAEALAGPAAWSLPPCPNLSDLGQGIWPSSNGFLVWEGWATTSRSASQWAAVGAVTKVESMAQSYHVSPGAGGGGGGGGFLAGDKEEQ